MIETKRVKSILPQVFWEDGLMKKQSFRLAFGIMLILILIFHFFQNYNIKIQPPSNKWGKEVLISQGRIKSHPKIIKVNDNYVLAHDDGDKIRVFILDKLGNKLKEQTVEANDTLVRNLNLLYDGKNIYINWIITNNGVKILNNIKLDDSLKSVESWYEKDIDESVQIDNDVFAISSGNKIEVRNIRTNETTSVKADISGYLTAAKTKEGYIVAFLDNDQNFKYFTIVNSRASSVMPAGRVNKDNFEVFNGTAIGVDDKYGYILIESKNRGQFGKVKILSFKLDGSGYQTKDLNIDFINYIYNPISLPQGDGAEFMAGSERIYGKKNAQYDIIDFVFKDGKISEYNFVTRTKEATVFPAWADGTAIFCDYFGNDKYNVYMTSMDDSFKERFNGIRSSEVKEAAGDTLVQAIYSLAYLFVLGMRWILIGEVLASTMTLFSHALTRGKKKIFFSATYIFTALIKLYVINKVFYTQYRGLMSGVLSTPAAGAAAALILSFVTFLYGYIEYNRDMDSMPIISYTKSVLIDAVLTLMLFVPFIF